MSVDAYHYFGTADLYIGYITGFLRDCGSIGVVAPALFAEIGADVPAELLPYWEWEFCSFHGPQWWRTHWERSGKVWVERADAVEDGWRDWLRFEEVSAPHLTGWRREAAERSAARLRVDRGRHLGFSRVVATKS